MTVAIDRRQYKRFDSFMVVEFKPITKPLDALLGITRNFSFGGFCFESQDFDLEPGDSLEFTFKNHQKKLAVSDVGQIVWKRKPNDFNCYAGISFEDSDSPNKRKVLELVSATENIHLDSIIPEQTVLHDQSDQSDLITDTPAVSKSIAHRIKKKPPRNIRINKPVLIVSGLIFLIASTMIYDISTRKPEPPPPVVREPVVRETKITKPFKIIDELEFTPPEKLPVIDGSYYVQVGAWKNLSYAKRTLEQLNKIYPKAFIVQENNFHKVRIPGVASREQGTSIVKDISEKFKIQSLVVESK